MSSRTEKSCNFPSTAATSSHSHNSATPWVLPPGGTRGDALQQAGPLPNVGGQRSGHNIYLLDGAKITDELFNTS